MCIRDRPKDVWVLNLSIKNDEFEIKGRSANYPSIGEFLKKLQSSVFFEQMVLKTTNTIRDEKEKTSSEEFVFGGKIKRYD